MRRLFTLIFLAFPLLAAPPCRAQARVRLPLDGYYRPGRYVPVAWEDIGGTALTLWADGAADTVVDAPARRGVAPWLAAGDAVAQAHWAAGNARGDLVPQPRALADDEKLVGVAGGDPAWVRPLLAGAREVDVALDPADPLPGPGVAWEALDAVALDRAALARLPDATRRALYAAGAALVVGGDAPPLDGWVWERLPNGAWAVRGPLPPPPCVSPDAYGPIDGWDPGRTAPFRRQAVLLGAVAALLVVGAALLGRSRAAVGVGVAVAVAAAACADAWDARASPVATARGEVDVLSAAAGAHDLWLWLRSPRDERVVLPFADSARPVWPDRAAAGAVAIACDGAGRPVALRVRLSADAALAVVSRAVQNPPLRSPPSTAGRAVDTPLRALVTRDLYPGLRAVGQLPPVRSRNPAVTVFDDLVIGPAGKP